MGFLDAGHVLLQTSADAIESRVEYYAHGQEFQWFSPKSIKYVVQPQPQTFVAPYTAGVGQQPLIDVTLETPTNHIGFGLAVVVLATVRNNEDHYIVTQLDLGKI